MKAKKHPMTAAEFNDHYPIGTRVAYRPVITKIEGMSTRTRTAAWEAPSGQVLVMVDGIAGGVSIEALTVLSNNQSSEAHRSGWYFRAGTFADAMRGAADFLESEKCPVLFAIEVGVDSWSPRVTIWEVEK